MTKQQALKLLKQNLKNANLIKHCLAVEAVMLALAEYFDQDQEKWALAGLLHDIDYEKCQDDIGQHSILGAEILAQAGLAPDICQAVKVHNEAHGEPPKSLIDKALFVVDPITGLIVAAVLVLPSRKLADLKPESVLKRFHEKSFARGANREIISQCGPLLNLSLEDFIKISLKAMQGIAEELGL